MRVLITRPRADAAELASELAALGHQSILEPLLDIRSKAGVTVDLTAVQAVLVTSANGVRALAAATAERAVPLFAVGDASARAARAVGFRTVESAAGDVVALAALVRARLDPRRGRLVHVAGTETAGDLKGALAADGFSVDRIVLYEAVVAKALSVEARAAFTSHAIDAALFFSPRTARTFANLVGDASLEPSLSEVAAVCLSRAVADQIDRLPWRTLRIASRPDQAALIAALQTIARGEP